MLGHAIGIKDPEARTTLRRRPTNLSARFVWRVDFLSGVVLCGAEPAKVMCRSDKLGTGGRTARTVWRAGRCGRHFGILSCLRIATRCLRFYLSMAGSIRAQSFASNSIRTSTVLITELIRRYPAGVEVSFFLSSPNPGPFRILIHMVQERRPPESLSSALKNSQVGRLGDGEGEGMSPTSIQYRRGEGRSASHLISYPAMSRFDDTSWRPAGQRAAVW
jgi:hypothetical protein